MEILKNRNEWITEIGSRISQSRTVDPKLFEHYELFEKLEDIVIDLKDKGLSYFDISDLIKLFVETPKVTEKSYKMDYSTTTISDPNISEPVVVREGADGCYKVITKELYKKEIDYSEFVEPVSKIIKVPDLSELIVEDNFSAKNKEDRKSNVLSYVGESYEFKKAKNSKVLSVGIDTNSSYKDDNIITVVFSDQRRPVSFVCQQYKNYLASLKGTIGSDPTDPKFNTHKTAGTFYRKTFNFAVSVVQKLKNFGVEKVYLGKSGCMSLSNGNNFMLSLYSQLITACSLYSLEVIVVDEHRTSLADSIANDEFDKNTFSGKRSKINIHIYNSGTGLSVDADVNAAYNILRKGTQGNFRVSPDLVEVSFNKKIVQLPEVNYM